MTPEPPPYAPTSWGSVSMSQSIGHDPLCEWSTPCIHGENQQHSRDTENLAVPDATYCWMCGADCHCDLIAKVREDERRQSASDYVDGERDMLAKCIAAVDAAVTEWESEWSIDDIYRALRAQQEKP